MNWEDQNEWLETDGLGGFASGTVGGIRTRRYHGLLLAAVAPPDGRVMLVNGLEITATTAAGTFPLSTQRYEGQVVFPEGFRHIESFFSEPWPTWQFRLPDGTRIEQQIMLRHGEPTVAIFWKLIGPAADVTLSVRPLLSGRDYHALHRENGAFRFDAQRAGDLISWQPYPSLPGIYARSNAKYEHHPVWYRRFFYQEEWLRGFEASEDLASPGSFVWNLRSQPAVLLMSSDASASSFEADDSLTAWNAIESSESMRRAHFPTALDRAGDQYIVRRGKGQTIIAGYPWFSDWGRDSFIALRGLCIATGRLELASRILLAWSGFVSEGMLPNRFPDGGKEPEYNSVDAALWYVIATQEFFAASRREGHVITASERLALEGAIDSILWGYAKGTRYGIAADRDGLLAAGVPGVQLTWMDSKIGEWVVTPRIGKPVEIQALWLNALYGASGREKHWERMCSIGCASFRERFWNDAGGYLFDVVDCDHVKGKADPTFRPNQILAIGGLPLVLLDRAKARSVVEKVEARLWTPVGLRSLATDNSAYVSRYFGGPQDRDAAYHQGTVWPWLSASFVEAWVRVQDNMDLAKLEARYRFVDPLLRHLTKAGLGHVSEIADGSPPHMPRGCPFQAWSVGELLRVQSILAEPTPKTQEHRRNSSPEYAIAASATA